MALITCRNVSKIFYHRRSAQRLLRQYVAGWFRRRSHEEDTFYALRNVSFEVNAGESVGIVGSNGAGKSTLLSVITGLAHPDEGSVEVNGRVAALLELGSGFHPDLTGRENIRLNSALLGFSSEKTDELFDSIVDFSGVREFIDDPLRTYSSGMVLRLAFSVAVNLDPEVLLVDEILAVGDQDFQARCLDRIRELRKAGKTLLCVSHAPALLLQFCDRGIWLDHGQLVMQGEIGEVLAAYEGKRTLAHS
jgi:ABC-type polysaccharide/polyol phosphate transport system ATPase subunit